MVENQLNQMMRNGARIRSIQAPITRFLVPVPLSEEEEREKRQNLVVRMGATIVLPVEPVVDQKHLVFLINFSSNEYYIQLSFEFFEFFFKVQKHVFYVPTYHCMLHITEDKKWACQKLQAW